MAKEFSQTEVRSLLRDYLEDRPDLGLGKAALAMVLEPVNPFEPDAARPPRKVFVVVAFCLLALVCVFVYFNLWSCP